MRCREGVGEFLIDRVLSDVVTVDDVVLQVGAELFLRVRDRDAVLGTLGAGNRGNNRRQVQFEVLGVGGLDVVLIAGPGPNPRFLGVAFTRGTRVSVAPGGPQEVRGNAVEGELRRGGPESG